ncbi:hypothetical protein OS242_18850 [Tumebacillus sp. DT12]|uniref:Uncharacterized protein n=1 Tax=Tumebacillus lacus TaxID=2995335 RepID=A0ABT3X8M3_9BACL|nr:hypothetical protein [Tumebacillus lacus]MCX7572001.1 hypothetical protein [Tumebacillus lacus]
MQMPVFLAQFSMREQTICQPQAEQHADPTHDIHSPLPERWRVELLLLTRKEPVSP